MPEQRFVNPRRFSEIWQMSEDWPGTLGQQVAVREALHVEFGSNQHKLLQKVDREVNRRGRSYLPIAFAEVPPGWLGFAGATGIVLSELLVPAGIGGVVQHEFGHVYDQLFFEQEDRDWFIAQMSTEDRDWRHFSETFADAFRDWWRGVGWQQMTNRLLRAP